MTKHIMLEHHPNDSRTRIDDSGTCQSLKAVQGGDDVPRVLIIYDEQKETDNTDRKEIL